MYFPVSQCDQLLNDDVCKTYDFFGIFRKKCRSCSFHVRVTIPKKCADDKLVHILVRPKGNPTTKKELFLALRQNILKHGRFWKCHTYLFLPKSWTWTSAILFSWNQSDKNATKRVTSTKITTFGEKLKRALFTSMLVYLNIRGRKNYISEKSKRIDL